MTKRGGAKKTTGVAIKAFTAEQTAYRKAANLIAHPDTFWTFAEIGAAQEVSRYFFRAGQASRVVAKTISAYAMEVSNDIYLEGLQHPETVPYTGRFRLAAMLHHEYDLLKRRFRDETFAKKREGQGYPHPALCVYANTVAVGDDGGRDDRYNGWMGARVQRFQLPGQMVDRNSPANDYVDLLAHVVLLEQTRDAQRDTIGSLGVNLLDAAVALAKRDLSPSRNFADRDDLVGCVMDAIDRWKVRIDVLEVDVVKSGRTERHLPHLSLSLLEHRCANGIVISNHRDKVPRELYGRRRGEGPGVKPDDFRHFCRNLDDVFGEKQKRSIDAWAYPRGAMRVPVRFLGQRHLHLVPVGVEKQGFTIASPLVEETVRAILKKEDDNNFVLFVASAADLPRVQVGGQDRLDGKQIEPAIKRFLLNKQPPPDDSQGSRMRRRSEGPYCAALLITGARAKRTGWLDLGWLSQYANAYMSKEDVSANLASISIVLSNEQWQEVFHPDSYARPPSEAKHRPHNERREEERETIRLSADPCDCLLRIIATRCAIHVVGGMREPADLGSARHLVEHMKGCDRLRC